MKKTLTLAAAGAALIAAPALAGSPEEAPVDTYVPAPAPVVAPSGDWTGAYGGLQFGYADVETSGGTSLTGDDMIGGATFGYDYDFGNWVLGAAVDYDFANVDLGSGTTLENLARLKMRAGYDLGNGLLYATGGIAQAEIAGLGKDTGYVAGIGYEHMLTQNISLGGELLYHSFDGFNGSTSDVEATTAQAKVNFRF